jgi:hypothetical protein
MSYIGRSYLERISEKALTNREAWLKLGLNTAVTTEQDLADYIGVGSSYIPMAAAGRITVVSTSGVDVDSAGMIQNNNLSAAGANYQAGDIVTITQVGGSNGTARILTVGGGGMVLTYEIVNPGTGYNIGIKATVGANGANFTINVTSVSGAAGAGARTVKLRVLAADYSESVITVSLNGTTATEVTNTGFRVNSIEVATAGGNNTTSGNISVTGGGNTIQYILAGRNESRTLFYTVPLGHTLYINDTRYSAGDQASSDYVRCGIKANYNIEEDSILQVGLYNVIDETVLSNSVVSDKPPIAFRIPATVDLKGYAYGNSAAVVETKLRGYLAT